MVPSRYPKALPVKHRKASRLSEEENYVLVTPLQPPFDEAVTFFNFNGEPKTLAVSRNDGERIYTLLDNNPEGRTVAISAVGNKVKVEALLN